MEPRSSRGVSLFHPTESKISTIWSFSSRLALFHLKCKLSGTCRRPLGFRSQRRLNRASFAASDWGNSVPKGGAGLVGLADSSEFFFLLAPFGLKTSLLLPEPSNTASSCCIFSDAFRKLKMLKCFFDVGDGYEGLGSKRTDATCLQPPTWHFQYSWLLVFIRLVNKSWSLICPNDRTLKSYEYQSQPGLSQLSNPLSFGRIGCLASHALVLCWVPRGGLRGRLRRAHRACSTGRGGNWSTFAWLGLFRLLFVPFGFASLNLLFSGLGTTTYNNKIRFK